MAALSVSATAEADAISAQIRTVAIIAAASAIAIFAVWLRDRLWPSRSTARTTIGADRAARKWTEDDLDKVYLIAPSPYQRWTSQYSHPRSELTPSFGSASAADERLLKDLLTPSKDWWQGHRAGTASNTPDTLQRLDFGEAPLVEEQVNQPAETGQHDDSSTNESGRKTRRGRVVSAAKATRSSRVSRRLDRSALIEEEETETEVAVTTTQKKRQRAAAAAAVAEEQEETVAAAAAPYASDDADLSGGGGRFGDDADESESLNGNGVAAAASDAESDNEAAPLHNGYDRSESPERSESRLLSPASPASPGSLDEMRDELASPTASRISRGGRRSSGTPSRHRRQWTHTVLPGVQEPRIHRIAPLQE